MLNVNSIGNTESKKKQEPRKHNDFARLLTEGRKKYECASLQGSVKESVFIDELIEWFKTSKHVKQGNVVGEPAT